MMTILKKFIRGMSFLLFNSLLYSNMLLQSPQRLSQQEIKTIEQESIQDGWGACWERLLKGNKSITFNCHNGIVEIDLILYGNLPNYIDEKTKKLFTFSESIKDGEALPVYSLHIGGPATHVQAQESLNEEPAHNEPYTIHERRDLTKTPQEHNPKTISVQDLKELIKTKRVIFYTGAGISAAAGVWTMQPLMDALGIDPLDNCDTFMHDILVDPKKKQLIFADFCKQAFTAQPTPAHNALASIALAKKTHILTENFDLLQEHAGVKADHISGPWLKANVNPHDLKDIDAIICIALSYDDRGFLGWYKENNPYGTIVAIDLVKPSYLGNEDFLLQGDCQKIIPALQEVL
jgi:NAD-dependent SIR2 family protein deacetylase